MLHVAGDELGPTISFSKILSNEVRVRLQKGHAMKMKSLFFPSSPVASSDLEPFYALLWSVATVWDAEI